MKAWASILVLTTVLTGCAGESSKKTWEDIDYSKVQQPTTENDPNYTAPSVIGCVDDDLYNCSN